MPSQHSIRQLSAIAPGHDVKIVSSLTTPRPIKAALAWWDKLGYPVELIVQHFEHRIFELAMALGMFGEGMLLLLSPDSLQSSVFTYMLESMSYSTVVLLFVSMGLARITALGLNGHWMPYGGYVRAIGAAVGTVMWAQMDVALWLYGTRKGVPLSPGIPIYFVLTQFEIVSVYRALAGVRRWADKHGSTD